jgi:O-antigen/teichoic acid export membrane protein
LTAGREASRLILRGSGSTAAGFVVRLGARLLFLFAAGQLFGATLFGAFSLAVAMVELGVTVAGLGTKRTLFKYLDEHDPEGRPSAHVVLDAALLILLVGGLIAAAAMAAALLLPRSMLPTGTATAMFVLAPMIAGQALIDLFSAATRWRHLIRYEVVGRSLVEPYAGLAGTLAAYLLGFRSEGLLVGYWAGTLSALLFVLFGARRALGGFALRAWRASPRRLAEMLHGARANTLNDFLNALYGLLDLFLVGMLLGERSAGIYGMARQVRTPIRQVRQSFDGMLTPVVSRTLAATGPENTGRALASAARLILAIQLPILIALAALGVPLLSAIGPEFALGYWALILLAAAETIQGAFSTGDLLFVFRRPKLGLVITATSIFVGLAAGAVFISLWGVTGAALSVLVSIALRALHRRHALRSEFGVSVPLVYSAGPFAAAILGTLAALLAARLAGASDLLLYAGAVTAGLGTYALALLAWTRATGSSLALEGFVAGQARA